MDNIIQNWVDKDIADGVLAIRTNGEIMYINQAAKQILALSEVHTGDSFIDAFEKVMEKDNDIFFQCFLDAIYDKTEKHHKNVTYTDNLGNEHYFRVTSSFFFDEEKQKKEGVVICFSDITAEISTEEKPKDSTAFFVLLISSSYLWLFFYSLIDWFQIKIPKFLLFYIGIVLAVIFSICILKCTNLRMSDMVSFTNGNKKSPN